MNGVGDRCRAVLLLVRGPEPLEDAEAQQSYGYHCGCSVTTAIEEDRLGEELLAETVKEITRSFCEEHKLCVRLMDSAATLREIVHGAGNPLTRTTAPITLMECKAADVKPLRARLLGASSDGEAKEDNADDASAPYCLLAIADVTRHRRRAFAGGSSGGGDAPSGTAFGWLRPTQSYLSEYQRERKRPLAEQEIWLFPLHMYCALPMIRSTGFSGGEDELLGGDNVCTLEGILRELGYKAGQLPKYGA